jgi:hypothetical protein
VFSGWVCWAVLLADYSVMLSIYRFKGGISKGPTTIGKVSLTNWFLYIASVVIFLDWFGLLIVKSIRINWVQSNLTTALYHRMSEGERW